MPDERYFSIPSADVGADVRRNWAEVEEAEVVSVAQKHQVALPVTNRPSERHSVPSPGVSRQGGQRIGQLLESLRGQRRAPFRIIDGTVQRWQLALECVF